MDSIDSPDILRFTLNGQPERAQGIPAHMTLLQYLRSRGYVGTKEGCAEGDCGACTVAVIGHDADGHAHYQAVNSCLIPAVAMAGRQVISVEGLAEKDALHPVQAAMASEGGSQCGYCTPGFIMSMFAAHYNSPDGKVGDQALEGNLCRCTGYLPIRRAGASLAAPAADDRFVKALQHYQPAPLPKVQQATGQASQPAFYQPTNLDDALALLEDNPKAILIAGSTDLGVEMNHHRLPAQPLISLEHIPALQQLSVDDEAVTIGAALPLSQLETRLAGVFPALDTMLFWFASRQIRNRATVGGNLATASPIGDLPPVLLALDAELELISRHGSRQLAIADFFQSYRQTALQAGEIIARVRIPKRLSQGATQRLSQSYKVGKRGTDDISIVSAAFCIDSDAQGNIVQARLAYGGVAATPLRISAAEQALLGKSLQQADNPALHNLLQDSVQPISDLRASADYRRRLVSNLFRKFLAEQALSSPIPVS